MAKFNINFNNKNYSIDESALSSASAVLKSHLSTVMNGTGATITLGDTAYNIDSTKLATATNAFVSHLGTVAGNGYKVVIGGVEYHIDSAKMQGAVDNLHIVFGGLHSGDEGDSETYTAGLYETGSIALYEAEGVKAIEGKLIKSWDELVAEGTVCVDNGVVYTPFDSNEFVNPSADALVGDLMLPDDNSITSLGDTYYDADSGMHLGNYAFRSCGKLTGIKIPNSVTTIDAFAFVDCASLNAITIPNSVTSIGGSAFDYCENLTSVIFENNSLLTTIDEYAFSWCANLTNIIIPTNVSAIGQFAFWNCSALNNITFEGTIAQWNNISKGTLWNADAPATEVVCSDGTVSLV